MSNEFVYSGNATLDDGSEVLIDFEERGWADKEMLGRTVRWSLVPTGNQLTLDGRPYPLVQISIPEGGKPIFRTRVFRGIIRARTPDQIERNVTPILKYPEFRVYCIGWKKGRTKVWTWVLPTGAIEVGTGDDSHLSNVLRSHLNTIITEVPISEQPQGTQPEWPNATQEEQQKDIAAGSTE